MSTRRRIFEREREPYVDAFSAMTDSFEVLFASKAAPITAIYEVCREQGLSVDVASGGELHMALRAGFEPERIYMHGNNKTEAELRYAFESGVGCLVLDSFDEIARADALLDRPQRVLIRLTPGIKPSTHSYVQTGQLDSKFGFGLTDGLAGRAVDAVDASRHLELVGLHAHIGSQIFELEPYLKAIEAMADFARDLESRDHQRRWRPRDRLRGRRRATARSSATSDVKVEGIRRLFDRVPRILIEPGRSLVGNAGLTIYRVGTVKEIPGVRTYVAVDGGMSDNLRPMLYDAGYEAADRRSRRPRPPIARRRSPECTASPATCWSATRCSPAPAVGDRARHPGHRRLRLRDGQQLQRRPAAAGGVLRGRARLELVVRRETWDDLLARDV